MKLGTFNALSQRLLEGIWQATKDPQTKKPAYLPIITPTIMCLESMWAAVFLVLKVIKLTYQLYNGRQ